MKQSVDSVAPVQRSPRIVFIANSMYSKILSGGDIHTLHMAEGAVRAGYPTHFLAGHALQAELLSRRLPVGLTLTDEGTMGPRNFNTVSGQLAMLRDYLKRLIGALGHLAQIHPEDWVYANTDFWWDSLPAILCRARRKLMILGMDSPTWPEIIFKSRPDVKSIRLPSIHYWLSQTVALRWFRWCKQKRLLYIHPNQLPRLRHLGYREEELIYISNGIDVEQAEQIAEQPKTYDLVWTGRVHKQKGIEDLLETLEFLAARVPQFRAILIGNVKQSLGPRVDQRGLSKAVDFSGFVSEAEKFRLLKSSRLFLMPSHYESWGIVIGEALACGVPVVAYDLPAYRPIFENYLCYIPCFDREALRRETQKQLLAARAGKNYLARFDLSEFKRANSWQAAQIKFCGAVKSLP